MRGHPAKRLNPAVQTMTPTQLLQHTDSGQLWPADAGNGFTAMPAAYQTALAVRDLRIARGEHLRGYKIGFTNRSIWQRYNVSAPVWGCMWNTSVEFVDEAQSARSEVKLSGFCQPRLEPEAVFCFKATPPANPTDDDLFNSLDWVAPGFELVQSHQADWKFIAPQAVADGALHARLIVGRSTPVRQLASNAVQLHTVLAGTQVSLQKNGSTVETGVGANVLDSPLHALMHFLNELRACPGAGDVKAGDVVTTGTWTDAWPVSARQTWTAQFDGALPQLEVVFV
jgi:2-keto-4-pentenoate hydratase